MSAHLTEPLRARLAASTRLSVQTAVHGGVARAGELTLCPGWKHLTVRRGLGGVVCSIDDRAPQNGAKPSADLLFASAARHFADRVLAVVLTGTGNDGLEGARSVTQMGGEVWVQDQASSTAWGMPGAIASAGLASVVVPLHRLGEKLHRRMSETRQALATG